MKTIKAGNAVRNALFSVMVLIPFQLHIGFASGEYATLTDNTAPTVEELPPSAMPKVVLLSLDNDNDSTETFLNLKKNTINFMSKTFGVDASNIIEDLLNINDKYSYNEKNIGLLKDKKGNLKEFKSFEEGLIEYMFNYCTNHKSQVSNKRVPYTGKSDYVVDLIKYFTSIYDNVDYLTAVSIGAAESGYYKVTSMLRCNNIYGGMSKNGLIKYKNIEYGVLNYIRLLSKNYYAKGLTTVESIGVVYCPRYENGKKVASSHWISLVNTAKKKYAKTNNDITVETLLNIEED